MILSNERLEFNEGNGGRSIVEVVNENCGTLDRPVLVDNVLDLSGRLDTLTTELDLLILSATVDSIAIGAVHRNITGPVEALSRDEEIGDEQLLGLLRLVEISTSKLNATDEQLSFDTDGVGAQILTEDVQSVVWERASNDASEGNICNAGVDTIDGGLSGRLESSFKFRARVWKGGSSELRLGLGPRSSAEVVVSTDRPGCRNSAPQKQSGGISRILDGSRTRVRLDLLCIIQ